MTDAQTEIIEIYDSAIVYRGGGDVSGKFTRENNNSFNFSIGFSAMKLIWYGSGSVKPLPKNIKKVDR